MRRPVVRLNSPNRPSTPGILSGRVALRLFSLALGAAAIGLLIHELNRPQVAQRLDQVMAVDAVRPAAVTPVPSPPADPAQFRELLSLAGWNSERFRTLQENDSLTELQRDELVELLWRLKTFDGPQLAAWARAGNPFAAVLAAPDDSAGEIVELKGRVTKVTRHELRAEFAARLELPAYFECEMTLDDGAGTATILTPRVPRAWLERNALDEPAVAAGVFIRKIGDEGNTSPGLFVSREIAWHPTQPQPPYVSLGKAILGELGVDIGQLDLIRQRHSLAANEREAFYQVLDAAGRIGANQLTRFARQQLPSIGEQWAAEAKSLTTSKEDQPRRQLAREVQARAAKGLYSVASLFNEPANQVGELVLLEGTVRRVTRIDVGKTSDGAASDVARRFGINHYYELDLFTDDSQNNPIVVCVRELPPGFPVGNKLHEPIRVAGWFFKSWNFESRRATLPIAPDGSATPPNLRQFAPLVIGRSPVLLETPTASTTAYASTIAAGLFVVLLALLWVAGWWIFRDDKRFATTLAKQYSLPEGESLNELQFDLSESAPPND